MKLIYRIFFLYLLIPTLATLKFSYTQYLRYWHGTIFAVQTVDFNILHHTIPTRLSYLLIQENPEELQNTLDSNYGLFGIVVTDCRKSEIECPEQNILFSSESKRDWKKQLSVGSLENAPYDVLRNPPPLFAERIYGDVRDQLSVPTGKQNRGMIIGRVYYIRGIPPTYPASLVRWFNDPLGSGTNLIYTLIAALCFVLVLLVGCIFEVYLYLERAKIKQWQKKYQELETTFRNLEFDRANLEIVLNKLKQGNISSEEQILLLEARLQEKEKRIEEVNVQLDSVRELIAKSAPIALPKAIANNTLPPLTPEQDEIVHWLKEQLNINGYNQFPPYPSSEKMANHLAENYTVLLPWYWKLRTNVNQDNLRLTYKFSTENVKDRQIAAFFCNELKKIGFLSEYRFIADRDSITLTVNRDPQIVDFFRGKWLQIYIDYKFNNLCNSFNFNHAGLRNVMIDLDGQQAELNLVFIVNRIPIVIQTATGDLEASLETSKALRQRLNLYPEQYIIVTPDIGSARCQELTALHGITIANKDNFQENIEKILDGSVKVTDLP